MPMINKFRSKSSIDDASEYVMVAVFRNINSSLRILAC